MHSKFFSTLSLLTAVIISACSQVRTGSIVLQGEITGDPVEVVVLSYLPGQVKGYHYPEVKDGRFEFTMDDVKGFADLIVSVGGVEFGARVNARDTLRMSFTVNEYLKDVTVSYDGANEKESRIWTDFYETYDHMSNYGIDADVYTDTGYEANIALLEKNDSIFRTKYKADLDDYHIHCADLAHDLLKAILLDLVAYRDGKDSYECPEYVAMIEKVDPNDPEQMVFPMVYRWMSYQEYLLDGSQLEKDIKFMQKFGKEITNPDIKALLADSMAPYTFASIDTDNLEIYEPFFAEMEKFAPNGSDLVSDCRKRIEAALNSGTGKPVPDTALKTPDGKDVQLSSLFGKVLYIDMWATWCGPCLKEGPSFRALAEKFKDDPRICFISISTDSTDDPWLEYLAVEKPFWPQYRLAGGNNDFCTEVGIYTIPRFLLVDTEGNFIDADCARPSSDDIDAILIRTLE